MFHNVFEVKCIYALNVAVVSNYIKIYANLKHSFKKWNRNAKKKRTTKKKPKQNKKTKKQKTGVCKVLNKCHSEMIKILFNSHFNTKKMYIEGM